MHSSVYRFESGLEKYWIIVPAKFKLDAGPPGHDPGNLTRRKNLEMNIIKEA